MIRLAAPRTRTLPRATPISWEAESPTLRLPAMRTAPDDLPAPAVTAPPTAPARPDAPVPGRFSTRTVRGGLALTIALVLLGGLELAGVLPG